MAHATTIKLESGANSVTLNGPPGPTDVDLMPNFVSDLSAGHLRWSYQTTARRLEQWSIRLDTLTADMRLALEAFFHNVAKGPANTFTYTHTDQAAYTARFVDDALRWQRKQNEYSVQFTLEITNHPVDGTAL